MSTLACLACGNQKQVQVISYLDADICICPLCENQWSVERNPRSPETVEYNYYMDSRSYGNPAEYPPFRHFFRQARKLYPGSGTMRILDVGCGTGVFLQEALRQGHECFGLEADSGLREFMPPVVAERVVFGRAEEVRDLPSDLEVITFWDSFEHFDDPFSLAKQMERHLKRENGFFFARTNHNYDVYNLFARALLIAWPAFGRTVFHSCFHRPIHVWNFSREGLTRLLQKNGFDVLHYSLDETPACRLTQNRLLQVLFKLAYGVNRAIGGGKISSVYFRPDGGFRPR